MTAFRRLRTLRGRMVAAITALMALALTAVAGVSAVALHNYLIERTDQRIEVAAEYARARQIELFVHDPAELVRQIAAPSEFIFEFTLDEPDAPDARMHKVQGSGPPLLQDIDVATAPEGVFTTHVAGAAYRATVVYLPAHDATVLIALPLQPVHSTVGQLVAVEALTGSVVLLATLALASAVIRRGLRPLDDVIDTAEAIASDNLERRVPAPSGTAASEAGRLTTSINRMLERLRAAMNARAESEERLRRFVSDASHELRTPLTSIRGYLQMVSQGVVNVADRPDVITRSEEESERMSAIVDDLLYLARLDEQPTPRREVVELSRVVTDSLADARAAQPERTWRTEIEAEGLVLGDEQALRQTVANLLANVRVHTPVSSPAVAALRRVAGRVIVEIRDAGPGVPEETAAFVFERFYRGGSPSRRPGSGLGLSIVRAVMRAHGGEAFFTSSPEEGTVVRLEFPLLDPASESRATRSRDEALTTGGGFSSDFHLPRESDSSDTGELAPDRSSGKRGRTSMAQLLYRLGGMAFRRRWLVVVTWLVLLATAAGAAAALRVPLNDSFTIPGTESQETNDLLEQRFSERSGGTITVVAHAPDGSDIVDDQDYVEAVRATAEELRDVDGVESVTDPYASLSEARERYDAEIDQARQEAVETARERVEEQVPPGTPNRDEVIAGLLPDAEEQAREQFAQEAPEFDEDEVVSQIPLFSESRSTVLLRVQLTQPDTSVAEETIDGVLATGDTAREAGLEVEYSGQAISVDTPTVGSSEAFGVLAALVVLLINFGAVVAAGLPIVVALIGVGVGMSLLYAAADWLDLTSTAPIMAIMLGIAVGIDYALFVLSRHRKQVADGMAPEESAARAIGTAGSAVVFAGATVIIALLGLSVVGIPFLTIMGLAAVATVAVAVLVAITLLPALLGFLGRRVTAGRLPVLGRHAEAAMHTERTLSMRWVRLVTRRPLLPILAVLAVLVMALIPVRELHLGLPNDATSPEDTTQRQAYEIISDEFGPGFSAPLLVVADLTGVADTEAATEGVTDRLDGLDGVQEVTQPQLNEAGDTAIITVIPENGPSDYATEDLLHEVRDLEGDVAEETGAQISVTGSTAATIDISERLGEALPMFLAVVIGLALVLMTVVFRSILVPVKAALGFVLSAGGALGMTVAVFQLGYGADLLGVEPAPTLVAFMPVLLIGILFGLAMDYEVFLVSRMREDYVHGGDARAAIVSGFGQGARVVTAAAVIMTIVFGSFVFSHNEIVKSIAFALAAGVVFDAFLVRMTLVPAVMALFGRAAWWLPRWLAAVLPNVDIEGERLARPHHQPATAASPGADEQPHEHDPARS
ncbi:MMPL family transporter [Salinactinospora qingdaonensis]|uniref:histidine kinase n=1 Tax=Salinactinospora qingdaonensis TaxID=702744 RepID=A0ABP7FTE3_9ACTN